MDSPEDVARNVSQASTNLEKENQNVGRARIIHTRQKGVRKFARAALWGE